MNGSATGDGRVRILFVCLGNICRSPTAEGVMRALVRDAGLEERIELDSAGTGAWHIDQPPDARATAAARERGIALQGAARQIERGDFAEFDLIVAMDASNLADLRRIAPDDAARAKLRLLREFDLPADGALDSRSGDPPADETRDSRSGGVLDVPTDGALDVPDPYHGGARGFDHVFDLIQAACAALLAELRQRLPEPAGEPG
jgi:protein-tyrosine phosphatase